MDEALTYKPDYTVPVMETIREMMEDRGWDRHDLAIAMCEQPVNLEEAARNYMIVGMMFAIPNHPQIVMSDAEAYSLERAFGVSAEFWKKRHETHRLACAARAP